MLRVITILLVLTSLAVPARQHPAAQRIGLRRHYLCMRAPESPRIDGRLDDVAWVAASWSESFVDIEGGARPAPRLRTRMKLLWDDRHLYIAGEIEEPHVWGTLNERDAVIYRDDDFELFIDPDGDTHNYYELEVNALGTVWDLFLVRPYRDGGPAISAWDIAGLRSAVAVDGTVNDPSDRDRGWTVELAIPWAVLEEAAPGRRRPRDGEQWWFNFSRVDWDVDIEAGGYVKRTDPATGRPLPEHNWVWSPQGAIDMHRPEMWGIVQFSDAPAGSEPPTFVPSPDRSVREALRRVYDAQRSYYRANGRYAADVSALGLDRGGWLRPAGFALVAGSTWFEAEAAGGGPGVIWRIREDGRLWSVASSRPEQAPPTSR